MPRLCNRRGVRFDEAFSLRFYFFVLLLGDERFVFSAQLLWSADWLAQVGALIVYRSIG